MTPSRMRENFELFDFELGDEDMGEISALEIPGGPGVRVDSAMYQGYTIPPFYDSMVGKLIVWALTRDEAVSRARRALKEYRLEGIKTTIPLHQEILRDLERHDRAHSGQANRVEEPDGAPETPAKASEG